MQSQTLPIHRKAKHWIARHKVALWASAGGVCLVMILFQLWYPSDHLVPFASIGTHQVGGWKKADASWKLDQSLSQQKIPVYLGSADTSYASISPKDIGLTVSMKQTVNDYDYPLLMRFIPTSLLWYHFVAQAGSPTYERSDKVAEQFITDKIGKDCLLPAKNATIKVDGTNLQVEPAKDGGECEASVALAAISGVKPKLGSPGSIRIPVKTTKPEISTEEAKKRAANIANATADGVVIQVNSAPQTISQKDILSWLTFNSKKSVIAVSIDKKKADDYLLKNVSPKVTKAAGTTYITTRDFTVTSKKTGSTGKTLDTSGTIASILDVVNSNQQQAVAKVKSVAPRVQYSRSYTHTATGIQALITYYDVDHAGTFGVSFQELGGQGRSAQYNGGRVFVTASTYKLFVAYGTLKRVDAGKWKWTDKNINGGRNLATCFDDMIVKSDNECAKALLLKIGVSTLTNEIQALGLTSSTFMHENIETTPNDLRSYLVRLQNGTLPISSTSRARLLDAMKRQIYRQGIPSGASGTVADKVGFLWALLHDAAIVYSPKGTYVLVIMTDGSSWANIADLTRKIEALR